MSPTVLEFPQPFDVKDETGYVKCPYFCQERMKMQTAYLVECKGRVKLCGYYSQGQPWKSGKISVHNNDGTWYCSMTLDCSRANSPIASIRIKKDVIKRLICKNRLIVEFKNGQTFLLDRAKTDRNLRDLTTILTDLSSGALDISSPGKPAWSAKENTVTSTPVKTHDESLNFTRMKEPKSKQLWEVDDFVDLVAQDNLEKENASISAKKTQPLEFLNRSAEKSRETLKTIGSSSFYSNKTQTPFNDRVYGSLSMHSSNKRTPGLMPDPTPNKRPRLSNVPYSWSKNKTSTSSDSKNNSSLQGFSNLGNTCYMNAILQSLFGLETFALDLLMSNRRLLRSLSRDSLYYNLSKLLSARKKLNVADSVRRDLLRNVKTAISSSAKRFSGYQQHDAHEFLGQVLDQLKEEVVKLNKATPSPSKDLCSDVMVTGQEYVNPTIQNFEFEVLHTITCSQCGETVTKTEQFNDLSLDLPRHRSIEEVLTIQDALDLFLRDEQLEYTCAECGCKQAQVFHSFTRLPRVLIVHLKRYTYNIVESSNTKTGRSVFVPRYLTLQTFCTEETQPPFQPVLHSLASLTQSPVVPSVGVDVSYLREDPRTDVTRRKLDYSGNRFSGTFRRVRSVPNNDSDDDVFVSLEKKPRRDSSGDIRVPDEDEEFVEALEMSLQGTDVTQEVDKDKAQPEQTTTTTPMPVTAQEPEELTEEQQLQKVLEISRLEAQQNSSLDMSELQLENMTEEEMFSLAMQRSILESANETPRSNIHELDSSSLKASCKTYGKPHRLDIVKECSSAVMNSLSSDWSKGLSETELDHTYGKHLTIKSKHNCENFYDTCDRSPIKDVHRQSSDISDDRSEKSELSYRRRSVSDKPSLKGGAMELKTEERSCLPLNRDVLNLNEGVFSEDDELVLINSGTDVQQKPKTSMKPKPEHVKSHGDSRHDEVDGGRLPDKGKLLSFQTDEEFLTCQEPDDDLEDKENKTPPPKSSSAQNTRSDPDWLTERQEHGSREPQEIATFDLDEEDPDIRKAKELSLQELAQQADIQLIEDDNLTNDTPGIQRSKEDTEMLNKHFEDGHLPCAYKLVSVVSHIGSTSSAGHYVSDVYDFRKSEWYSYNDSHVTKTTESEIRKRRERSGYIFFYMCKNIHEDLVLQSKLQVTRKDSDGT